MSEHQANPPETFPQPPAYPYPLQPPVAVQYEAPEPRRVDPYQHTSARLLQDRNATVAEVTVSQHSSYDFGVDPDFQFKATGSSKREQGDRFNPRTGELISLSRAYLKLSRQLMSAARELVEPEPVPEYRTPEPEDNFIGVGAYAEEPVLQDPTDEDVEWAKHILEARVAYNMAVAEELAEAEEAAEPEGTDPRVVKAVEAFNGATDSLMQTITFLRSLTEE